MKKTILGAVTLSLTCVGLAQANPGQYQGNVATVMSVGTIVLVTLNSGSGQLLCGSVPQFWLDTTTSSGQAQLALAITAKTNGAQVYVQGNGTCTTAYPYNNTEQLYALNLE